MFSSLEGFKPQKKLLSDIIKSGEVSSRYLIKNPDIGSLLKASLELAKKLLCQDSREDSCKCRSCQDISSSLNQRDLLYLNEEKYTVDNVQEVGKFLIRKSFGDNPKVVLIQGIQNMNTTAQNKLLKILEEPPSNACFILTQSSHGSLLPTISSRCVTIDFYRISYPDFLVKFGDSLPKGQETIYYRIFEGTDDYKYYEDMELIRKSIFHVIDNLDSPNFIDKLRFPKYPFISIKSIISRYPFNSTLRIILSFLLDRTLVLTGAQVFYNLDMEDQIKKSRLLGKQVFSRTSCLWKGNFEDTHLNPWIWLQGVLVGSETV